MIFKKIKKVFLAVVVVNLLIGCSGWKTVTFREIKKIEQLRGQPGEIYVRTTDSKLYLFSRSNYYIQNDTVYGLGFLLTDEQEIIFEGEFALTNVESIEYYYEIEQDVEVYYDPEKDSIVGYKYAGAKAYIEMNDGSEYAGELLTVRDSIMIVCEEYEADEQDLVDSVYSNYVLNNSKIKLIELYVGNYSRIGAGVGLIAGSLAGGVAAYSAYSGPDPYGVWHAWAGATAAGFVGAIIGGIIGAFFPDYDFVYEYANPEEYDFKKLNIYARYVNNEPEFLKKIK